ncbi:hypothetical protein Tco_0987482 [Tanacetum coccineum]
MAGTIPQRRRTLPARWTCSRNESLVEDCGRRSNTHGIRKELRTLQQTVLVEEIERKTKLVNEKRVARPWVVVEGDSWMTPIHEYLTDETLPAERKKARAIKRKSQCFVIINGTLYKKSFLGPWLRCVGPSQANYVLREIHEGSMLACHIAGHTIVVAKLYGRLSLADNAQGQWLKWESTLLLYAINP